jgi:3-deoxy-D-manno-octulosonic-acid transferase
MRYLYAIAIRLYAFAIRIAAFFLPKAKEWVNGRKNTSFPTVSDQEVYWFHCASLGEFDQGLPVMNRLKAENPSIFIVVTFFSPSGYLHFTKRKHSVDFACYIPIDTAKNANRFVRHFNPKVAVFVKYEFWSFHIEALKKNGTKLYSISTSLRPKQHYFKWYGSFFRKTLRQFDYFFAQNQTTVQLLNSIGIQKVMLTGDTRFDRVIENKNNLQPNILIEQFVAGSQSVFIAGSTWPKDEELISKLVITNLFDKYIIAPHNVDEVSVERLIKSIAKPVERYSQDIQNNSSILIIDSIGQLASAYSYAHLAYVGGGFSKSLHNILEPAVFGLPVIFGPIYNRFPEAQAFIDNEFGFSVSSIEELLAVIENIDLTKAKKRSIQFLEQNTGASQKIVTHIVLSN